MIVCNTWLSLIVMLASKFNFYLQLGARLKTTMWDLLGLIYSEKPLDIFDHSRCKTEGWAEQVSVVFSDADDGKHMFC